MSKSKGIRNAHRLGRKLLDKSTASGICAFGIVGKGIKDVMMAAKAPCHANLNIYRPDGHYHVLKMVDRLYPSQLSKDQRYMWYSYILKRSPYAPMCAEKNILTAMERGYFIYHTDIPANILVAGAVAIRMPSEKSRIVRHFCNLVKAGADEDMAYIVAHSMVRSVGGKVSIDVAGNIGHVAIAPLNMNRESILRFFKRDIDQQDNYSDRLSYTSINFMFGERINGQSKIDSVPRELNKLWLEANTGDGNKDKRVAIFNHDWNKAKTRVNTYVSSKKGYKVAAEILNNYRQEVLNANP